MPEDEAFWDFYWELRLREMENLGKRAAILAASPLIRKMAQAGQAVRVLELGCGEGQIIGSLANAHDRTPGIRESVGVDYNPRSLERCRADYPGLRFVEGDITDPALLGGLGTFQMVLLVNALHEVFSTTFDAQRGEVDAPAAKTRVTQALGLAAGCLAREGWLVLFDGLEPPGDPNDRLRIRFLTPRARAGFDRFANEYHPFHIRWRQLADPQCVELSRRDFTRYIDKSIFLEKALWQTERLESYQYFTEDEFRTAFAQHGLAIRELRTLTVNEEKWRRLVRIETRGERFPQEHILILAQCG